MFNYNAIIECVSSKHALIGCLASFNGVYAYLIILGVLFICGLGVPIPEDITLMAAGILAALGKISLTGAIICGFVGVMLGDALLFFIGRFMGRKIFQVPIIARFFPEHRIAKAEEKILNNSKFICFIARFLPGLRSPIFLTSGVMGVSPVTFFALDGFAAIISVPLWVYVGFWIGDKWDENLAFIKQIQIYLIIGVVSLIVLYIVYKKFFSKPQLQKGH